jgi:quercetin dioxygenase-like cupin family protein
MHSQVTRAVLLTLAVTSMIGAEPQAPADRPAVVRKMLLQRDLATPNGYTMSLLSVEIAVGGREGRHTHSGALAVYVQEGQISMETEGKPAVTYKPGETLFIEGGTVHEGVNVGTVPVKALATLITPKGQPLTTPVS